MTAIVRRRGDTKSDLVVITKESDGLPFDITGYTFVMYITTDKAPDNFGTNLLYQVPGTIVDALAGKVEFVPTTLQATQPDGSYFYEIKMTSGDGRVATIPPDRYRYY
jgi:hypothetical protein